MSTEFSTGYELLISFMTLILKEVVLREFLLILVLDKSYSCSIFKILCPPKISDRVYFPLNTSLCKGIAFFFWLLLKHIIGGSYRYLTDL